MTKKYKKIFSMLLVFIVALATGVSIGMIYVDNLQVGATVSATEEDLREDEADVLELVNRAKTTSATSFSALELYLIAEYKLNHSEEFYKLMTGTVYANASVKKVNQQMKSQKVLKNGILTYNKLSPSTSSVAPQICSRIVYDYDNPDQIKIWSKGTIVTSGSSFYGTFAENAYSYYTREQYQSTFNTQPTSITNFIISSITTNGADMSAVSKNADGTYSFTIKLEGDYCTLAALYYSYEIKFSSGLDKAPLWTSLEMSVTVDSDLRFQTINYIENYKMYSTGMWVPVKDTFTDTFVFDNVPDFEEVAYV